MDEHVLNDAPTGISRRDAIKKTVVAGAIVWSAPVLLARPASASSHGTGVCENFHFAKIDGGGCSGSLGHSACFGTTNNAAPGATFTGSCAGVASFTFGSPTTTVVLVAGAQFIEGKVKAGNGCFGDGESGASVSYDPATRTITFFKTDPGALSNVQFAYCLE